MLANRSRSRRTDTERKRTERSEEEYRGTIDSAKTAKKKTEGSEKMDPRGSEARGSEAKHKRKPGEGSERGADVGKRSQDVQDALRRLQAQMKAVNKKLGIKNEPSPEGDSKDQSLSDVDEAKSENADADSTGSQQFVPYGEFKKAFEQMHELKKNVGTFKSRLLDFERDLLGGAQAGPDNADLNSTASLQAFHKNLRDFEAKFAEKLEHVDLLKGEMKHELKRL